MRHPTKPAANRRSTITDVARAARVSVASVSRVVNDHDNVAPATRKRVLESIAKLRYVPDAAARGLITKRTQTIGVLLPDLYGEFFSELIRGIDGEARHRKLHLLLSSSHGDTEEMAAAIRAMHGRVEGLLVLAPQLEARGLFEPDPQVPTVFINSRVGRGASSLAIDSYGAAREMVRHLVAHGHRTIAHVAGPLDNFDAHERERGYRDELAASLPRAKASVLPGDFTEAAGYAAGRALARATPRPAAVFAANDASALGVLAAFAELGVRTPDDIAVVGFDDVPLAAYSRPALTTMHVPIVELGRAAMVQLAAAIADPAAPAATTLFRPVLVERESCGSSHKQPVSDGGHHEDAKASSRSQSPRARRARRRAS